MVTVAMLPLTTVRCPIGRDGPAVASEPRVVAVAWTIVRLDGGGGKLAQKRFGVVVALSISLAVAVALIRIRPSDPPQATTAGTSTTEVLLATPTSSPVVSTASVGPAAVSTGLPTGSVGAGVSATRVGAAGVPTSTTQAPGSAVTTTAVGLSTTTAVSGPRNIAIRTFADGALRFELADRTTKVIRSKASAVRTAKRELPSGTLAPTPEVFFARYALETNERVTGGAGQPKLDLRAVWVVRFAGVEGRRQSSVVLRQNLPTLVPVTTIPRVVVSDIIVVVDDVTGDVLLRSEFASETDTAR